MSFILNFVSHDELHSLQTFSTTHNYKFYFSNLDPISVIELYLTNLGLISVI